MLIAPAWNQIICSDATAPEPEPLQYPPTWGWAFVKLARRGRRGGLHPHPAFCASTLLNAKTTSFDSLCHLADIFLADLLAFGLNHNPDHRLRA